MTNPTPTTDEYVPTTAEIRVWVAQVDAAHGHGGESIARFDRWLSDHDRKIAAEAWDAAVKAMRYEDGTPVELVSVVNPYRADRTEQGGES